MTRSFHFQPFDTLFFRDGRPYNQDDPGQSEAQSLFPPYPPTMVGALRSAAATKLGWPGERTWKDIASLLGDGLDWQSETPDACLEPLRFSGPWLVADDEFLVPVPECLMASFAMQAGRLAPKELTFLMPGPALETDLPGGAWRVPQPRHGMPDLRRMEGWWLTGPGLSAVLNGNLPNIDQVRAQDDLFALQTRVGIGRDAETRTAAEGQLFTAAQVRLARNVSLAVEVEGLSQEVRPAGIHPFGGEHRFCSIEEHEEPLPLPTAIAPDAFKPWQGRPGMMACMVILLSPASFDTWPAPGGQLSSLPGRIASGCVGRPVMIGGWNSVARAPIALQPHLPAGSVWFLEVPVEDLDDLVEAAAHPIGKAGAWGFGRIALGTFDSLETE